MAKCTRCGTGGLAKEGLCSSCKETSELLAKVTELGKKHSSKLLRKLKKANKLKKKEKAEPKPKVKEKTKEATKPKDKKATKKTSK